MAHSSGGAALQEAISILFFTGFILFLLLLCQRGQFGSLNLSRLLNGIGLGAGRHERRKEPDDVLPDTEDEGETSNIPPPPKPATVEKKREPGRTPGSSEGTEGLRERRRDRPKPTKEDEGSERLRHEAREGEEELKTGSRKTSSDPTDPEGERERGKQRSRRSEKVAEPEGSTTRTRTAEKTRPEPLKVRTEGLSDTEEEEKIRQREEEREAARRQREPESQDLSSRTLKRKAKERDLKRQTGVSQSIQSAPLEIRHESLAGTSKHSAPPDRSYIPSDPSSKTEVKGRTRRLRHKLGEGSDDDDIIDRPDGLSRLDNPPRSAPLELKHHRLHRDGDLSAPPEGRFSRTLRDDDEIEDEERVEDRRRPELRGGELPEKMGHQSRRYTRVDKSLDSSAPSTSTSSTYPYLDDWLEKDQERVRALPQSRARRQGSKLSVDIPDRTGIERSVVVDSGTEAEDIPVGVVRAKHNRRGHRKRVSFAGTDSGEEADQENQPPSAGRKPKKNILKKDRDGDGDGGGGGGAPSPSGDYDNLDDFMDPKGPPPSKKDSRKPKSDGEGGKGGGGGQRQASPTGDDDNLDDFVRPDEATTPPARESRKAKEDPKASSRTKKSKTASTPPPPEKGKKSARSGSGEESAGGGDDPRRVRIDIKTDQGDPEKKGKKDKKETGGGGADDGGDDDQTKKKKTKKKQMGESSDEPDDGEDDDGGKKKVKKDPKPTSKKPQKGKKDQAAADDDDDDDDPANPPVKKKKKKPSPKGDGENADDDDDDPDSKDGAKKKKKTTKQGGGKSGNDRGDDDDDDDLNDDGPRQRKRRGGNGDGGNGNGRGKKGNQGRGNNNYDDDPDDDDYAGGGGGGGRARQRRGGQGGGNYQNPQDPYFSQGGNPNQPKYNQGQPYPGQDTQTQNGQNPGFFNNMFTRTKNGKQPQANGGKQGDQTAQPLNNAVDGTTADGAATDGTDETTTAPGTGKGTKPPQVKKGQAGYDAIDADSRPTDALGGDPLDDETDSNEDDDPIGAALKKATGKGPNKDPSSKDGDPPEGDNPEDGGDGDPMGHSERTGGGGGLTKQQRDAINDAEGEESDPDGDGGGENLDELERSKVEEVDRLVRDGSADEIERFLKQKDPSTKKAQGEDNKQNTAADSPPSQTKNPQIGDAVTKDADPDGIEQEGDRLSDSKHEESASQSPLTRHTQDEAFTPTAPAPVPSPLLEKPSTDEPTSNPGKFADKALAGSETPTPRSSKQAIVDDLPSPATPPSQQLGAKTEAGIAEVAQKHDSEVSPSPITQKSQEQSRESLTRAPLPSPTRQNPAKDAFDGSSLPVDAALLPSPAVKKSRMSDFAQASPATRRGVNTAGDQDSESEAEDSPGHGAEQLQGKTKADATQDTPSGSPDTPNYAADQLFYKTEENKASRTAAVASPITPERTTTQSEDAATKQKQEPAKVTSPRPGLSKNDIPRDKPSSEDTDSILDAYTEQDPIINNVSTGNPTLVESKDLHEPQQAVFMSVDDDRRASTDSGYGTKVPSPTSPARNGASKEAERTEKMRAPGPEPEVSPLTPAVQSKTVQLPLTQQATNSPISPVSPVETSPVKQESEAPRVQQEGLGQVPEPQKVDVDDRRENEASASHSNTRGPREQNSSESDGEGAPAVASQSPKTEAQQKNKQMQEVDSEEEEEEEEKLDRTKGRADPSTQQASGKPAQEGQKEGRESGESDGATSPAKQGDQGSRERDPETERGGAESEETDSESDFEDQDLLNKAQKGKNSQAGLIIQKALRTTGNLTEAQIKAVKGARGMLRLKPKQLEEPFILARAFKMGDPAPGPPTNWERVWRDDKGIPETMRTGGSKIPAQKTTGPRQQEHAMAHNGHGEGQMKHKDKDRPKADEQSDAETSEGEDGGVKAKNTATKASKGQGHDVDSQTTSTQAAGSFLHPWRLVRYTFSTIKHAPVWSAATLVSTLGYVGGAYFWYIVLNSSQSATSLAKRDSSSISNAASSVAKMGVDTQLAFTILNIYCFFGLLLLALMAHTTMGHAETPGRSQREWIKHPFQTLSKGGRTLAASVSGILGVVFMQAGLNGPMTFWHKMGWWTAMRLGVSVIQLVLLGLSNNQVISLAYMTITQEPNPPFSTWDVQYTASTLGLAAKSLDARTMLALASAWLFFFISIATWSWYSLLHPSAKHQGKHKWSFSKAFKCGCAPGWVVESVGVVLLIVVFGCFIAFFTEVMAAASKQVGGGSGQSSFVLANGVFLLFAVLMTWVGFELDKFGRWLWPKMSGSWCK